MPELLRRERATVFDFARERVVGVTRLWYQDLLLREDASQTVDPARCLSHPGRRPAGCKRPRCFGTIRLPQPGWHGSSS